MDGSGFVSRRREQYTYEIGRKNAMVIRDQDNFVYIKDSKNPNQKGEERWTCRKRTSLRCRVKLHLPSRFTTIRQFQIL